MLEVLDIYIDNAFHPVFNTFDNLTQPLDFEQMIIKIVDETVATHHYNSQIHEALHSLTATDNTVNQRFLELEEQITKKIADKLIALGYDQPFMTEKVHIAIQVVQSFAHECVFDKHSYIDYGSMRNIVVQTILHLIS